MTDASRLEQALVEVGTQLASSGYRFWAPTPETHAKVVARLTDEQAGPPTATTRQDLWGWSLPLGHSSSLLSGLSSAAQEALFAPGSSSQQRRPLARFSSLYPSSPSLSRQQVLYAHSPWPTTDTDAVFFGPDTYRFLRFLDAALGREKGRSFRLAVDVGCGAGAGAIHLAAAGLSGGGTAPDKKACERVVGLDINERAFTFAKANAALHRSQSASGGGGAEVEWRKSDLFSALSHGELDQLDLVISNPPYIAFDAGKGSTYADGGEQSGLALPVLIARQALERLSRGGLCMLYTGVPISLDGSDPLRAALEGEQDCAELVYYDVMDVDVFGDELRDAEGAYGRSRVGQIAVIGAVLRKR